MRVQKQVEAVETRFSGRSWHNPAQPELIFRPSLSHTAQPSYFSSQNVLFRTNAQVLLSIVDTILAGYGEIAKIRTVPFSDGATVFERRRHGTRADLAVRWPRGVGTVA